MSRVLIFAGTTEGRLLAQIFEANKCECDVCVATDYGRQMIKASEYIHVFEGRLDSEAMMKMYKERGTGLIVDATHPYASIVTETIKESLAGSDIEYIRLMRPESSIESGDYYTYENTSTCVKKLLETEGRILLTTGSKELSSFAATALKDRLIVRVLPGMESLKLCYDAGLEGKQIVAMQGPFSEEMNEAVIRQYGIEHLVTKESGSNGGFEEKILAAHNLGIKVHVIKRPVENPEMVDITTNKAKQGGLGLSDVIGRINSILNTDIKKPQMKVALIGIGCGDRGLLTKEAADYLKNARYVFGAERMLNSISGNCVKYPYYLKDDIIPKLIEIYEEEDNKDIAILFSGDSGFYSGAKGIYEALKEDSRFNTVIMPGISSVSYLAAKTGIDWGSAKILSLHGKEEKLAEVKESVLVNKVTFMITSGLKDIKRIGNILKDLSGVKLYVGYNLSYEDEEIKMISPEECENISSEGLYTVIAINDATVKRGILPKLRDEEFIRDKVPMTKEAIRQLSLCKLGLKEGDVVYDIGSGTGSIAVQTALLSPSLKVYAIECKKEAVELIVANANKFAVRNLEVIKATAPDGLENIDKADCAFIGGSKGKLKSILDRLYEINSEMRIVINAVSLESITEIYGLLNEYRIKNLDITQASVSVAQKLGDYNLMQACNPVYIFSFDFNGEDK